jgi:hypothetical protein
MDDYNKQNLELKSLFDEIDLLKRFKFVGLSTSFLIPPPSPPAVLQGGGTGGDTSGRVERVSLTLKKHPDRISK